MRGYLGVIALVWVVVGVLALWQRGYLTGSQTSCATAGTIALTVVAGPLNYAGLNPRVTDCRLPQPSALGAYVTELLGEFDAFGADAVQPQETEWSW